ncbi:CorA family divalent cation transporter [Kribbia dieselivorans]|uniref:CorA family divalent cation transporter n=1 Tax=Kribbia dieselivorans TaxID=331526 RepID=UPI00083828DA|nr:CorA family divalent cation transporter [Kribbia dieselivorans]
MITVDDLPSLRAHDGGPVCVLAESADGDLAAEAARELGLEVIDRGRPTRHPRIAVTGQHLDAVLFTWAQDRRLTPIRLVAGSAGLLVVAERSVLEWLGRQVRDDEGDVSSAFVAALLCVAHHGEDTLAELVDATQDLEGRAGGYTSAPERREMSRLRIHLFEVSELATAQRRLLSSDEELAEHLGPQYRRMLRRAEGAFEQNRSMAAGLYAMLGDLMNQQATVVSERLTLVATVFMPLTLATGFFGMNFGWMTERIGALPTFITLGVMLPVVLSVLTLALVRRLTLSV